MIRTGYLRWEIDVQDDRCRDDERSREVIFLARPSFRTVRIKQTRHRDAAERFVRGEAAYDSVLRTLERDGGEIDVRIPDVGPRPFRYSESDRGAAAALLDGKTPARSERLRRRSRASGRLVSSTGHLEPRPASRLCAAGGVGDLPRHRREEPAAADERRRADAARRLELLRRRSRAGRRRAGAKRGRAQGIPRVLPVRLPDGLIGDKYYRIPRRPHGLLEVWDAKTRRAVASLCVVFQDPGMPPSDEVVMKYLLAKHQPELLWKMGVRFSPPTGKFEVTPPRRWSRDD